MGGKLTEDVETPLLCLDRTLDVYSRGAPASVPDQGGGAPAVVHDAHQHGTCALAYFSSTYNRRTGFNYPGCFVVEMRSDRPPKPAFLGTGPFAPGSLISGGLSVG